MFSFTFLTEIAPNAVPIAAYVTCAAFTALIIGSWAITIDTFSASYARASGYAEIKVALSKTPLTTG